MRDLLLKEAYRIAKEGDYSDALKVARALLAYGMTTKKLESLTQSLALTHILHCEEPVYFGVVKESEYRISETLGDNYIGVSPDALSKFYIKRPVYARDSNCHEVLFQLDGKWFYVCLKGGGDYGGQVVYADNSYDYSLGLIPYFDLEKIKAKAQELIAELGDVDYYVWERPDNFSMPYVDYRPLQQAQTALALEALGVMPKTNEFSKSTTRFNLKGFTK